MRKSEPKPSLPDLKRTIRRLPFAKKCQILESLAEQIKQGPQKDEQQGISLAEAVRDFLHYIQFERKKAKNTVIAYKYDLSIFLDFCRTKKVMALDEVDVNLVQSYLGFLTVAGQKATTINRKLACIKSLFRCAVLKSWITYSPIAAVERTKEPVTLPTVFRPEDIDKLIEAAHQPDIHPRFTELYLRDVAMIEALYASGCRTSELAHLRLDDLDFEHKRAMIISGKGGRDRLIYLNDSAVVAIKKYLDITRPLLLRAHRKTDVLFLSRTGRPLNQRENRRILGRLARKVGLKHFYVHAIRHSVATSILESGVDLLTVKELLGHSSIATTQVYTHLSQKHLQESHKKFHPRK